MHSQTRTLKRALMAALFCICFSLLGFKCSEPPEKKWVETPKGFVSVNASGFVYKAVSPDGAVIGIRARGNEEKGDLDFWSEVFKREMTEAKGYTPGPEQNITSADGVAGKLLSFDVPDDRTPHQYQVALFISEEYIVSLETLCESPHCDRHKAAFEAAIKTLNAKTKDSEKK